MVDKVCASLPPHLRTFALNQTLCKQWFEEGESSIPSLQVTPAVWDWQEGGQLLSFVTPQLDRFENVGWEAVYQISLRFLHQRSLAGLDESRWTEFFGPDFSPRSSWRSLYKLPIEKLAADLQWMIVYGAIATDRERTWIRM